MKSLFKALSTATALFGASMIIASTASAQSASAIFAGGCFWCVEADFDKVPGVLATTSGFAGGTTDNPTYGEVTSGGTGHYEVVKIDYDPRRVSYDQLLEAFWYSTNPTDPGGQFCDRGDSYRTAIIATTQDQFDTAQASKTALLRAGVDIVTPILPNAAFYPAGERHQNYHQKNPLKYRFYRSSCGRERTVKRIWGKEAYRGIPGKG